MNLNNVFEKGKKLSNKTNLNFYQWFPFASRSR